ncbi:unnamed protein product [Lactuca saligna]|uniref:Uncharacterized protein n=1 Tax=Lactuca saligna TaxID=75948 RepID=A0AA35ZZK2_LACSI|nr:unnamed protein product [Lactuca saligna]
MDALTIKEEKCKVLETKLRYTEKHVDDFLSENAVTRSCIFDITGLLFDIIDTCDRMISITIKKHLAKKLCSVFAMLHRLEGVMKPVSILQEGGKGGSKVQLNEPPKALVNPLVNPPVIKKEPKCKEKLFNDEPIINDEGDEEPDEAELKRRKAREAELDKNAHIVREEEEKEKADKEDQATLRS